MSTVERAQHIEMTPVEREDGPRLVTTCQDDQRSVGDPDLLVAIASDHLGARLQFLSSE